MASMAAWLAVNMEVEDGLHIPAAGVSDVQCFNGRIMRWLTMDQWRLLTFTSIHNLKHSAPPYPYVRQPLASSNQLLLVQRKVNVSKDQA